MKKIAIKGHKTRGREVIKLLESLGGKLQLCPLQGNIESNAYFIDEDLDNLISCCSTVLCKNCKIYTLEEFKKEFPFKIGDNVITNNCCIGTIIHLIPEHISSYCVRSNNVYAWYTPAALRLYKDMNTRNITLTLDKAKEWYNNGGELKEVALQAFTEQELNPLPKSWKNIVKDAKFQE